MKLSTVAVIGILIAAAGILGFLYHQETKDDIKIKLDVQKVKVN